MEDLRECPCCGKPGQVQGTRHPDVKRGFMHGWVGCPACGLYIQWTHDPAGAIRKWNRREPGTKERIATGPAAPRNDTEGEAAAAGTGEA
ncbi:MAG: Lar family restriction alleviation protein [Clostridia bacterium]|nr:Lar family restriction alleviation protein [Clostridia bacterium]